jgi:transcriptional regulator with XRE-family HTH domain
MNDVDVGERLLLYRDALGWSQERTAREAGVSPTTITHIETGQSPNPRRVTLRRLARAFGVSLEEFLSDRPPKARGPSLPATILRREAGHDYLALGPDGNLRDAQEMSVPEVLSRINDLVAEREYLLTLDPAKRFPKATARARAEIKELTRQFLPTYAELLSAAEKKAKAVEMSEEERDEALAEIERVASEALARSARIDAEHQEANANA